MSKTQSLVIKGGRKKKKTKKKKKKKELKISEAA